MLKSAIRLLHAQELTLGAEPGWDSGRRARLLGSEPAARARQTSSTPSVRWICDLDNERLRQVSSAVPGRARDHANRARCLPTRPSTRSSSPRPSTRTTTSPPRRSRRASTCSSRSRWRRPAQLADELRRMARGAGPDLMCGHTFLYSPPVRAIKRMLERGQARRHLLHLVQPREPRPAPARRQRDLGPRPARLLDPALLAQRDADERCAPSAATRSSRASPTWRS